MARLIVQAVSAETSGTDLVYQLQVLVSVSRADDGSPVTGLGLHNFRIASTLGLVLDPKPQGGYELEWEPGDVEPAGCYKVGITRGGGESFGHEWFEGEFYQFAIQVRTFEGPGRPLQVADQGQTIVRIESLGR